MADNTYLSRLPEQITKNTISVAGTAPTPPPPQVPKTGAAVNVATSASAQTTAGSKTIAGAERVAETPQGAGLSQYSPEVQAEMKRYPGITLEAALGNITSRAAQEKQMVPPPVVLTSEPARKDIQKNLVELASYTGTTPQKPTTISAQDYAKMLEAQGQTAAAQQTLEMAGATDKTGAGLKLVDTSTKDYGSGAIAEATRALDENYNTYIKSLNTRIDQVDAQAKNTIASIQEQYAKRREEMNRLNQNALRAKEIIGTRTGRQRYAPTIQQDILTAEEKAGIDRITQLDSEERAFINQAQQAADAEHWKLLSEALSSARESYKMKIDAIQNQQQMAIQNANLALTQAKEQREQKKNMLDDISTFVSTGGTLSDDDISELSNVTGYTPDFIKSYADMASEQQDIAKAEKIVNVLTKIPENETITIGNSVFSGMKEVDQTKGLWRTTETNKQTGEVTEVITRYNPQTQKSEIVSATSFGNIAGTADEAMPTSYKEWKLAGEPGTYQDWVRKSGLRPLPATQATTLSEGFQIPLVTKSLDTILNEKGHLFGPVEGLKALNPWDVAHKTIDDDLRRASQVIGKYMEGGVLRKEDEEKYRRMLPQITDTIEVAKDKLRGVKQLLADKSQQYLNDYESAGFDVSGFVGKLPGTQHVINGYENIEDIIDNGTAADKILFESLKNNPELRGKSEQDVIDFFNEYIGFKKPLSMGKNGSLDSFKQSIITQESGGNYNAIGSETQYGRALGKYQIIPQFHFSKIGLSDTQSDRQKFLKTPQLQDKLFSIIIDDLNKKYNGDYRKMAAAYYGGSGAVNKLGKKAADIPQGQHPSINEYVESVLNRIS